MKKPVGLLFLERSKMLMSFFKNKIVVTILCVAAAVLVLGTAVGLTGGSGLIANAVNTVFSPVQSIVSAVTSSVDGFTVFIWEMQSYKEENQQLVSEINKLKKENRSIEDYKKENDRLTALLGLKESMAQYETTAARIVAYEPDNWYETIVINKGKNDGIEIGNVVVAGDGVVGQIAEIGTNWARVSAIINIDNAVGVRIVRTGDIAITEGDVALCKDGLCKMTFMSKDSAVIVGDIVETSGLGGIYPSGMTVGKVREIFSDNSGTLQYAVIEPSVDFDNLREVLVITDVE